MVELEQLAIKHNISLSCNVIAFSNEVYQQGRQSIFDAQRLGRQKAKEEGKLMGRPKGSKDKVKRKQINKYIYYLLNLRYYKLLSDKDKELLAPKIHAVNSKAQYYNLKQEIRILFQKSILERMSNVKEI